MGIDILHRIKKLRSAVVVLATILALSVTTGMPAQAVAPVSIGVRASSWQQFSSEGT